MAQPPKHDDPPRTEAAEREARLAKALRDNLRRRKAVRPSPPAEPQAKD